MENTQSDELNPKAIRLIDNHLKSRVRQAFAIIGIVNFAALYGIYTVASETAAELAVEKAIASTETQLNGLTKQFEQLSSRTTDGFANALMSLGEAKAKVDAINQEVLGLKSLDLKHVKEITSLLNKSSNEIINIIASTKALKETEKLTSNLQDTEKRLNEKISINGNLINKFQNTFSVSQINGATIYRAGNIQIETGIIFLDKSSHISLVKFKSEYKNTPTVVASGESNNKYDYGYAIVGDITTESFSITLSDKVANNNKTLPRIGGRINYIAIGTIKMPNK